MEIKVGEKYAVKPFGRQPHTVAVLRVTKKRAFCVWWECDDGGRYETSGWIRKKRFICDNETFINVVDNY